MQNVMQIATNAGHTAQNDGRTAQNDGRTAQNDGRNTLNVCQGPKGGLEEPPGPPFCILRPNLQSLIMEGASGSGPNYLIKLTLWIR